MIDVGSALTRKIGPIPAWGWGIGIGGGILAARYLRGGTGTKTIVVPTGSAGGTAAPDFVSELGTNLNALEDRVAALEDPDSQVDSPSNPPPDSHTGNPNSWAAELPRWFLDQIGAQTEPAQPVLPSWFGIDTILRRVRPVGENAPAEFVTQQFVQAVPVVSARPSTLSPVGGERLNGGWGSTG